MKYTIHHYLYKLEMWLETLSPAEVSGLIGMMILAVVILFCILE